MLIRDWAATLPTPEFPDKRRLWSSVPAEASAPLIAAGYLRGDERKFLIVTSGYDAALQWEARLALVGVPPGALHHLPSAQSALYDDGPPEINALSARAAALAALLADDACVVIASPQSVLERTLPPNEFAAAIISLKLEDEVDITEVTRRLAALGYENEEPVRRPGTFSRRGGILDIFPVGSDFPYRVEFFGDFVESIRTFDPETQRSLAPAKTLNLAPVRPVSPTHLSGATDKIKARLKSDPSLNNEELAERIAEDIAAIEAGLFFDRLELYVPFADEEKACALDYLAKGLLILDEPIELEAAAKQAEEDLVTALTNRNRRGEVLSPIGLSYQLPVETLGDGKRMLAISALGGKPDWLKISEIDDLQISSLAPYRGRAEALHR